MQALLTSVAARFEQLLSAPEPGQRAEAAKMGWLTSDETKVNSRDNEAKCRVVDLTAA